MTQPEVPGAQKKWVPGKWAHRYTGTWFSSTRQSGYPKNLVPGNERVYLSCIYLISASYNLNCASLQTYLSAAEFKEKFGMAKEAFYKLPKWKQNKLKMALHLFWASARSCSSVAAVLDSHSDCLVFFCSDTSFMLVWRDSISVFRLLLLPITYLFIALDGFC